jgi:hypothetical protein
MNPFESRLSRTEANWNRYLAERHESRNRAMSRDICVRLIITILATGFIARTAGL